MTGTYTLGEILSGPVTPAPGQPGSIRQPLLALECYRRLRLRRKNPDRDLCWRISQSYAAFHMSRRRGAR